jgi:hypothetical protein
VIDREAGHDDDLDRPFWLQRFDPSAQSHRGPGDEVPRREEDAPDAQNVTEARDDGIAAAKMALKVLVVQRQQVGLDRNQVGVFRGARREPLGGSHDDADVVTASEEPRQDAPASAPGAANEKNGLLL